ncbi:MAG: acetoin utilization protein AcuC [bacterium]
MQSAFLYTSSFSEYKLSENHPYDPVRGEKAYDLIRKYGLFEQSGARIVAPEPLSVAELSSVHSRHYLELLRQASRGEFFLGMIEYGIGTEDCPVFPGLLDFASLAAGATARAIELVLSEGYEFAFNPMGGFHHAGRSVAEGFCYVNDIAVSARQWADRGKRVAVVDIDAHHGNGTQDFFYGDPRVLTISLHESGESLYPWGGHFTETGEGDGQGFNVNIPMPAKSDDEIFTFAFNEIVPPLLKAFSPDLVMGVMGVDTFSTDPLTNLKMTNNSYVEAVKVLNRIAAPWVALGAGGYNMDNVARGWTLLWAAVHGLDRGDGSTLTLGGVFMGESDLGLAGLLDMSVRTSGPEKAEALEKVEQAVDYVQENVFPVLGA